MWGYIVKSSKEQSQGVLFVCIDYVKWLQVLEEWNIFPATRTESIRHIPWKLMVPPVSLLLDPQKLALFWNVGEQILIEFWAERHIWAVV